MSAYQLYAFWWPPLGVSAGEGMSIARSMLGGGGCSGGSKGMPLARPPPAPYGQIFFSISCSFSEILAKSYVDAPPPPPPGGLVLPPEGNPGSAPVG